jgi:hypothetical protein
MAELVTHGLIGGHLPTFGWWSGGSFNPETLISILEANTGGTPIFRLRIDLNGDGDFEIIEEEKLLQVGNLSKSSDFAFGLMGPASLSVTHCNNDHRWSDFYSKSYTYNKDWLRSRVILELNFDYIHKGDNEYWIPLFYGYIDSKEENTDSMSVTLSIIDSWGFIFDRELISMVRKDEIYNLFSGSDTTIVELGIYFGTFSRDVVTLWERDGSLLIPCTYSGNYHVLDRKDDLSIELEEYYSWAPLMRNKAMVKNNFGSDGEAERLWFWLWNDAEVADGGWPWIGTKEKIWVYTESFKIADSGNFYFADTESDGKIHFKDSAGGERINITPAQYFNRSLYSGTEAYDLYDPFLGIAAEIYHYSGSDNYWRNSVKCLYHILVDILGMDASLFDKENTGYAWRAEFLYPISPNYYSWDVAAENIGGDNKFSTLRISESTTGKDLIQEICALTGAKLFSGWGVKDTALAVSKVIKFTVPSWLFPSLGFDYEKIYGQDIGGISMQIDTPDIYNRIMITNFIVDPSYAPDAVETNILYDKQDATSIAKYGEKILDMRKIPLEDIIFWTENMQAESDAERYLAWYKRPRQKISFETNLKGLLFDLGDYIGIYERLGILSDPTDAIYSGVFEIVTMNLSTSSFRVKIEARFVGNRVVV